jgi:hypothetical protein
MLFRGFIFGALYFEEHDYISFDLAPKFGASTFGLVPSDQFYKPPRAPLSLLSDAEQT